MTVFDGDDGSPTGVDAVNLDSSMSAAVGVGGAGEQAGQAIEPSLRQETRKQHQPTQDDAPTSTPVVGGGGGGVVVVPQRPMPVRPMAVRPVRPMASRPTPVVPTATTAATGADTTKEEAPQVVVVVAPTVARPQVVRPMAVQRQDSHTAMLQRLAQDFQTYAPPVAPMIMDSTSTTTSESEQESLVSSDAQSLPPPTSIEIPLPAASTLPPPPPPGPTELSSSSADPVSVKQPREPQQGLLQKPTPVRPTPLKRSDSQTMVNQIVHDFQNLPTQQITISRAPSVAPLPPPPPPKQQPQPQPQMMMMPTPSSMMQNQSRPRPSSRRTRCYKPSWYHRMAAQNQLGKIQEDPCLSCNDGSDHHHHHNCSGTGARTGDGRTTRTMATGGGGGGGAVSPLTMGGSSHYHNQYPPNPWDMIQTAKKELLKELNDAALATDGSDNGTNTPAFQAALQTLIENYDPSTFDPRAPILAYHPYQMQMEGIGISVGKPTFPGCIGHNPKGHPMYKLGTMSFQMFRPTELVVSVQGTFCLIDSVDRNNFREVQNVPTNLQNDVKHGINPVRTYNIVTPFTIEPWRPEFGDQSPNKGVTDPNGIHGVMTTYGFLLPYPTQNRFSVWFTGGSLEVDGTKNEKWFQIFDKNAAPRRTAMESSKVLAAKLLMGACVNDEMDDNGTLKYTLTRPVASHIDLIYLDNSLQVLRGSSGTVYVHVRLPGGSGAVQHSNQSDEMLPQPVDPLLDNGATVPSSRSPVQRFLL